jgi:quercetin dioxygenase-like cupin family protein
LFLVAGQKRKHMTALFIILFIILLPVVYNLLFPLKPPRLDNYFSPGQTFSSNMEGVVQTILKQTGDKVYSRVTLAPGASGPPEHLHFRFNESGTVTKGTLTVKLNDEVTQVNAGSRVRILKGQYHTFFNQTSEEVIITCDHEDDFVPVGFAYALAQFYPLFDSTSKLKMVHFFFKMSMFGNMFDSYVKAAPVKAQKVIKKILQPYARVLGYKLYDDKSRP